MQVLSLASLGGLRIQGCHELWCRSQMQLESGIAVAVAKAGSCSSDYTPSLGTSICHECGHRKDKKKKKERERERDRYIQREQCEQAWEEDRHPQTMEQGLEQTDPSLQPFEGTYPVHTLMLNSGLQNHVAIASAV